MPHFQLCKSSCNKKKSFRLSGDEAIVSKLQNVGLGYPFHFSLLVENFINHKSYRISLVFLFELIILFDFLDKNPLVNASDTLIDGITTGLGTEENVVFNFLEKSNKSAMLVKNQ